MEITIRAIGLANPDLSLDQERALKLANHLSDARANDVLRERIAAKTGILKRHSVLLEPDKTGRPKQDFFNPPTSSGDQGPSTADRMQAYESRAYALVEQAVTQCLLKDPTDAYQSLEHVVSCSCTGFSSPGIDIRLIRELSLPTTITRTHVGFMGCHGLLNALRVSAALGHAQPTKILCFAVELCSLHYQYSETPDQMVANTLFADGAAALLLESVPNANAKEERWQLVAQKSNLFEGTDEEITWKIGDHGFVMHLSREVAIHLETHLKSYVDSALESCGYSRSDVRHWAIHPGGPRILDAVASALSLDDEDLAVSRSVLKNYGNMSSPTIAFILATIFEETTSGPVVALAFGPGITCELAIFQRGSSG